MSISHNDNLISDYIKIGVIGSGAMGDVIRAYAIDDPTQHYAIKTINQKDRKSLQFLHRFSIEAELMSQLNHPNIISIKEFGYYADPYHKNSSYFIVMDYIEGKDILQILKPYRNKGMSLEFFFQVAIQMAKALDYTHGKNIIHRDIKPHNILVEHQDHGDENIYCKLIDFGVATLGEVTNYIGGDKAHVLDKVVGTPLYMAPEMNANTKKLSDHRVDLYSLGCVLFQILIGRPPFFASSIEVLYEKHLKAAPERVDEVRPEIPKIVGDIIDGLLQKQPDDRYNSAFSLLSDLYLVKSRIFDKKSSSIANLNYKSSINGADADIVLKRNDIFKSINRKLRIIGRTKQLRDLIKFYNNVAHKSSRGHISVITGSRGSGKTRIINDLKDFLVNRKVKFISSSFIKYKSSNSLQNFTGGFNEYLLKVIKNQPLEAKKIHERIKTILGDRIKLIRELVPAVELFARSKSKESELNFIKSQKKISNSVHYKKIDSQEICKAITDFTRCLLSFNQPIVFIFDDIEFADEITLNIIDDFFSLNNSECIYLIISYSEDSFSTLKEHTRQFLKKMSRYRRRYQKIELHPLSLYETSKLVYHMLGVDIQGIIPICSSLYQICKGNPVHLIEKLKDLVVHGDIVYDVESKSWQYNLEQIKYINRAIVSIDLILSKINYYDKKIIDILEVAAVSGLTFRYDVLSSIVTKNQHDILLKSLSLLIRESLIIAVDNFYDGFSNSVKAYKFVHPNIREVIIYQISQDRLRGINLAIARYLTKNYDKPSTQQVFKVANLYYQGLCENTPYITPGINTYKKSMLYCMKAAEIAQSLREYNTAYKYYKFAGKIIELKLTKILKPDDRLYFYLVISEVMIKLDLIKETLESLSVFYKYSLMKKHNDKVIYYSNQIAQLYYSLLYQNSCIAELDKNTDNHLALNNVPLFGKFKSRFISFKVIFGLYLDRLFFEKNIKLFSCPSMPLITALRESTQYNMKSSRLLMVFYYAFYAMAKEQKYLSFNANHFNSFQYIKQSRQSIKAIDLAYIISIRLRYLNAMGFYKSAIKLYKLTYKHLEKYGFFRSMSILDVWFLVDSGYYLSQDYHSIENFVNSEKVNNLILPYDSIAINQLISANLTRMFLSSDQTNFDNNANTFIKKISIGNEQFVYIMFLRMFNWMILDKADMIVESFNKLTAYKNFELIHNKSLFFKLIQVIGYLYIDQFLTSKKLLFDILSKKLNYSELINYFAYQKDIMVFLLLIYPNIFKLIALEPLYKEKNTHVIYPKKYAFILMKFSRIFIDKSNCFFQLTRCLSHISNNKKYMKVVANKMNVLMHNVNNKKWIAVKLLLMMQISEISIFYKINLKYSVNQLNKALDESRKSRLISFARISEAILDNFNLPYPKRDKRGGFEATLSRFDHFPTQLSYKLLHNLENLLKIGDLDQALNQIFELFAIYYGAEKFYLIRQINKKSNKQVDYEVVSFTQKDDPAINIVIKANALPYLDKNDCSFISLKKPIESAMESSNFGSDKTSQVDESDINNINNKNVKSYSDDSALNQPNDADHTKTIRHIINSSMDLDSTSNDENINQKDFVENSNSIDLSGYSLSHSMLDQDLIKEDYIETVDCVVPINVEDDHKHYVYIEDLGSGHMAYSDQSINEIMLWSSQMYWLMVGYGLYKNLLKENKINNVNSGLCSITKARNYTQFHNRLDNCHWMNINVTGDFNANQNYKVIDDSVKINWIYGLNLSSNSYLLSYFCVSSNDDYLTNKINSMFWHNLNIYLIAYKRTRDTISLKAIRNDFVYFLKNMTSTKGQIVIEGFLSSFSKKSESVNILTFGNLSYRSIAQLDTNYVGKQKALFRFDDSGVLLYRSSTIALDIGNPMVIVKGLMDWSVQKQIIDEINQVKNRYKFDDEAEFIAVAEKKINSILSNHNKIKKSPHIICYYTKGYKKDQIKKALNDFLAKNIKHASFKSSSKKNIA